MNIVFHIGANKTGTSAIQGFLLRNKDFLDSNGILYPVAGRTLENGEVVASHYPLAECLVGGKAKNARAIIKEIEREADGYKTVVVSSELLHTVSPKIISDELSGHSVTVVGFIRDYVDYLSSWYRQAVKSSNMSSGFDFFAYTAHCSYLEWVETWQRSLHKADLRLFLYDRSEMLNSSAIDHFAFHILGLDVFPNDLIVDEENTSISGNLLFLKRLINSFISLEDSIALTSEVLELAQLDSTFQGKMFVDDATTDVIKNRFSREIEAMRDKYGIDLSISYSEDGSHSPSLCRLSADKHLIVKESKQRGFLFGSLITEHLSR